MTLDEIREKYDKAIRSANRIYIADIRQYLKDVGLDGEVIRKDDGKEGWLDVDINKHIAFYPKKKDGGRSLNASGFVWENRISEYYVKKEGE